MKTGIGFLDDLLYGEEVPAVPPGYIPASPEIAAQQEWARTYQKMAGDQLAGRLPALEGAYGQSEPIVLNRQGAYERGAKTSLDDARKNLRDVLSRRGMGNSSIGIQSDQNLTKKVTDDINAQRSMIPENIRALELEKQKGMFDASGTLANAGNSFVQNYGYKPQYNEGQAAYREGGAAPIIGGIAGGMVGGPQGAMLGYNLGQGLSQSAGVKGANGLPPSMMQMGGQMGGTTPWWDTIQGWFGNNGSTEGGVAGQSASLFGDSGMPQLPGQSGATNPAYQDPSAYNLIKRPNWGK
jgi:hypothetical protein